MTVAELITKLEDFPKDAVIYRRHDEKLQRFSATATLEGTTGKDCIDIISLHEVRRGVDWNYSVNEMPNEPYLPGFADGQRIAAVLL